MQTKFEIFESKNFHFTFTRNAKPREIHDFFCGAVKTDILFFPSFAQLDIQKLFVEKRVYEDFCLYRICLLVTFV